MPVLQDESRRLPPDSRGRKRYIDKDHRNIRVKVGIGHPLATSNGWALEKRLVLYESGVNLTPQDRVFNRDRDHLNNALSNLVVLGPGEGWPWPKVEPPLCRCGCGQRTARITRTYIDGHRTTWRNIQDEFTDRPVSRQRKFQLRWRKAGQCPTCRKPLNRYRNYCDECRKKALARSKARYHSDPDYRRRLIKQGNQWAKNHQELVGAYQKLRQHWGPKCFWPSHILEQYEQLKSKTPHENTTGLRREDIQDNRPGQLENHLRPMVALH